MTSFAFCTSVYESARPFLDAYMSGVIRAAKGHDCAAVIAVDGLLEPASSLGRLADEMPLSMVEANGNMSIAKVREMMLRQASDTDADIVVLMDADDWPLEDALGLHGDALSAADFSYGDLDVVDTEGARINRTFYAGSQIPERTTQAAQIRYRNWLGFSNTAVRREWLKAELLSVPEAITAVDWWFFATLLQLGAKGGRTRAPVVAYRLHEQNILGATPGATAQSLRKRCEIVLRHIESLTADNRPCAQTESLRALHEQLACPPAPLRRRIRQMQHKPGVWHEDVFRLAASL